MKRNTKILLIRSTAPKSTDIDPATITANIDTSDRDGFLYDPSSAPPAFGHDMLKYFGFDKEYVNVNHGSYGSLPLPVLAECNKLTLLAEANPDKWHRVTYMPLLVKAREEVATLIHAEHDEVVIVVNTTHGINAIMRNIEWREGDVILNTTVTYGAIERTAQHMADRSEAPRPKVYTVELTFPMTHAEIVAAFRAKIKEIKKNHPNTVFDILPTDTKLEGKGNRIVAIIDSISSNPGMYQPWKEMVKVCEEEGVWSLIDAAHSIGQELNIDLGATQPDFWVSNCHKWLFAKRGCAVVYVPKRNQHIIRSSMPTSHEYPSVESVQETSDTKFVLQHQWTGTMDFVPFLSVIAALKFRKWLGGEDAINGYTHKLAYEGGKHLASIFGTEVMDPSGEATLSMTNVRLPLPVEGTGPDARPIYTKAVQAQIARFLQQRFFETWNTHPGVYVHSGAVWARISVQVWTELADFEYVGKAMISICKEIEDGILANATEEADISERVEGANSSAEKAPEETVDSEKTSGCWIA